MNLSECPYCGLAGMVITMQAQPGGLEVTGKCTICGYSYDSEFDAAEVTQDLPSDFSRSLDADLEK